jgi:phage terminase large subunit-like protein
MDWLWFDEEPPMDIYSEGLTRTAATRGICFMTFTPLKGPTDVVNRFLDEPNQYRTSITMTIEDAEHIPADEKARLISSWPAHEREARARGVPMLGSGRIFTAPEDAILEEPIERIPPFWVKIGGLDFGIDHPFGFVLILWDKDADVIHVHHTYRVKNALPIQHADAIKRLAAEVPIAWPNDGNIRRDDGKPMADHYKRHGLVMLPSHATWPDGSISTEAGVMEIDEREKSGRLKYANHLSDLLEERRLYHRKDGQIVKLKDDLLSALRVAVMMKRFARPVQLGGSRTKAARNITAQGMDFDVFTGA